MGRLRVKNWEQFQHFKDRNPPWIKLYRKLLEDPEWHELDPLHCKALVMLWLLASEDEDRCGLLPDERTLAFRLRMSQEQVRQHVDALSHWLEQDDIIAISPRHHVDAPETETETETERAAAQPRRQAKAGRQKAGPKYSEAFERFWQAYPGEKRGMSKPQACERWERLSLEDQAAAMAALPAYAKTLRPGPDGFAPHVKYAEGWLKERRWETLQPLLPDPAWSPTGANTVMLPDGRIRSTRFPQTDEAWQALLATWAQAHTWPHYAGPDPSSTLCECPKHLLTPAPKPNGNGHDMHAAPVSHPQPTPTPQQQPSHPPPLQPNPPQPQPAPPPKPQVARKPPSPDEQRALLDAYLAGTLALDGPPPGKPGSLISPEIARERGLA